MAVGIVEKVAFGIPAIVLYAHFRKAHRRL
jgi:hypothetical protein